MVVIHLIFDLVELYRLVDWTFSPGFLWIKNWGGTVFLLLSGLCATLGRHNLRRGIILLACGAAVSVVTWVAGMPVLFGILHCLGACMVLWSFFSSFDTVPLCLFSGTAILMGTVFSRMTVSSGFWFWLGLASKDFFSADYFPLLPNLGFFLLGAVLGRRLYPHRKTLLPGVNSRKKTLRFLCFCGRHSLPIYLFHQPLILGILALV